MPGLEPWTSQLSMLASALLEYLTGPGRQEYLSAICINCLLDFVEGSRYNLVVVNVETQLKNDIKFCSLTLNKIIKNIL